MTTDFRALCVELTDCLEKADWPHRYKAVFQQWTDIAHAALAEPESDGAKFRPASLSPDALKQWDKAEAAINASMARVRTLAAPARAALAEREPKRRYIYNPVQIAECGGPCEQGPEHCDCGDLWMTEPEPVAKESSVAQPADGEVAELVAWLREQGQNRDALSLPGVKLLGQLRTAPFMLTRAASLLEHLSPPQPVPVSERLPGPEDCDERARCWWLTLDWAGPALWTQTSTPTHWLPAHALPLPEVQ